MAVVLGALLCLMALFLLVFVTFSSSTPRLPVLVDLWATWCCPARSVVEAKRKDRLNCAGSPSPLSEMVNRRWSSP